MPQFHPLTVTAIRKTIRDAVVVTLAPPEGADFAFHQGQYLTFRKEFDGQDLRRSYSICAGLDEGILQVGIKRVAGGTFSTWANEALQIGDVIEAMPPMGRFHTPLDPKSARHYLGFAGGSGITPILSIIKTVLAAEPAARFTLVYANRAVNTIMFRDELEDLKNLHMGRFNVIHVLETDAQEVDLFTGRVTQEKCAALFSAWIDIGSVDLAFICGPEPMMLGIVAALTAHGLDEASIKYELFASDQPGRATRPAQSKTETTGTISIAVTMDGTTRTITADRETCLLQAAIDNSLDPPFACRAGVCSTCRCKVLEGKVEMAANHALEDDEVAKGYVLSCQARALTDRIAIDYDQ